VLRRETQQVRPEAQVRFHWAWAQLWGVASSLKAEMQRGSQTIFVVFAGILKTQLGSIRQLKALGI
jgi:hypothetical protein